MTIYTTTTTDDTGWMVQDICRRCGGSHFIEQCPQVKAIEYDEQHRIKRIEFMTPGDYMPSISRGPVPLGPVTVRGPETPLTNPDSTAAPLPRPPYDITVTSTHTAQDNPNWHKTWTMCEPSNWIKL